MSANTNIHLYTEYVSKQLINDLLTTDLHNDYFTMLQKYKKIIKANKVQVVYSQKYKGIGRLYAKGNGANTLQNMPRELRNTLAKSKYIDVDMVNALPTIAYQECKKKNIKAPFLRKYNKFRDDKLQELIDEYNCSRDIAKQLPNRLMNGGTIEKWIADNNLNKEEDCDIPSFWLSFKDEMEMIYKGLYKIHYEYYKVVLEGKEDDWNSISRLCFYALSDKENDIRQCAEEYLKALGYTVGVPFHDGMLIEIKEGLDDELLGEMRKHIKQEIGFDIEWKIKPMEDVITNTGSAEDDDWEIPIEKSMVYDASFCMMIEGDNQKQIYQRRKKYVENFLTQTYHPDCLFHFANYKLGFISMYKRNGIIERLEDTTSGIFSDSTGREFSFTEVWLKDHKKNSKETYNWVPYNPYNDLHLNKLKPDTFNTFQGYPDVIETFVNPDATKILDLWKDVVLNLCEGNPEYYHYYICFLAQMVQDPSNRKGVAVGFKSLQGEGKGTHLQALSYVIGEDHYYSSDKMEDFFGNHSEAFPKRLLVNIDEVNGTQKHTSAIKTKITEKKCTLNAKNIRPVEFENFSRIVFTMNGLTLYFDMSSDDRRMVMFEGNGKNLKYKEYKGGWERIVEHWKKPEHIAALFNYLNTYKIDIDIINDRPMTEIYKTMMFKNKPFITGYMEQWLLKCMWREYEAYAIGYEFQHEPVMMEDEYYDKEIYILASQFRKQVNNYLNDNGFDFTLTPKQLYPELKGLNFPVRKEMKRGDNVFVLTPKVVYDYMVERKWIEVVLLEQEKTEIELKDFDENLFLV